MTNSYICWLARCGKGRQMAGTATAPAPYTHPRVAEARSVGTTIDVPLPDREGVGYSDRAGWPMCALEGQGTQNASMQNSTIFAVTAAVIGLAVAVSQGYRQERQQRPLMIEQAAKRGGTLDSYDRMAGSHLVLSHRGVEAKVRVFTRRLFVGPAHTEFIAPLPLSRRDELFIDREGVFAAAARAFGRQDIESGGRAFDQSFFLRGDEPFAMRYLTLDLQSDLLGIEEWDPWVSIFKGRLTFAVRREFTESAEYDRFIQIGLRLVDRAFAARQF